MRQIAGRIFPYLGLVLLMTLLLCALVEGPAEVLPAPEPLSLAGFYMLPADTPPPPFSHSPPQPPREICIAHLNPNLCISPSPILSDANGCVLRTGSYVSNAYHVFRQEDAAG